MTTNPVSVLSLRARVHNIYMEGEYPTLYCPFKTHCVKLLCNTHHHLMVSTCLKSYKCKIQVLLLYNVCLIISIALLRTRVPGTITPSLNKLNSCITSKDSKASYSLAGPDPFSYAHLRHTKKWVWKTDSSAFVLTRYWL